MCEILTGESVCRSEHIHRLVTVGTKGGTHDGQLFIGYLDGPSAIRAHPETKITTLKIILCDETLVFGIHLIARLPSADGTQVPVSISEDSRIGFVDTFNS